MRCIFNDEQRGSGPISPDPLGDGADFSRGRVAEGLVGVAPRRLPLLTPAQIRSRQERDVSLHRP